MKKIASKNHHETFQQNEDLWTPLSSSFGAFPDGATSQERADLLHKTRRELVLLFFTDIYEEQSVADGDNLYLTLLIDNLDGRCHDEDFLLLTHRIQTARQSGCSHGTPKFEEAMEAAGVFDVCPPRGCDEYNLRHRRLKISPPTVENAFGVCSHAILRKLPEMDDPERVLTQCKRLASFVAKEAIERNALASVAAWLIAEGIGGLMTAFEFQDKTNKILYLIDLVSKGDDFVNTFLDSPLLGDLLFTPKFEHVKILAKSPKCSLKSVLKCRSCDIFFVESLYSSRFKERLVFTGSLEKGCSPAELLKWKRSEVIDATVCPSCGLSTTSIFKRWAMKELLQSFPAPTVQSPPRRTSV
jgi:hypothetical protein